jgi:hypothetical protein
MGLFDSLKAFWADFLNSHSAKPIPGPLGPKLVESCPIETPWVFDPVEYEGWGKFLFKDDGPWALFPEMPEEVNAESMGIIGRKRLFGVRIPMGETGEFEVFAAVIGGAGSIRRSDMDMTYFLFSGEMLQLTEAAFSIKTRGGTCKANKEDFNCEGTSVAHFTYVRVNEDSESKEDGEILLKGRFFEWTDGLCYGVSYYSSQQSGFNSERAERFLMSLRPGKEQEVLDSPEE